MKIDLNWLKAIGVILATFSMMAGIIAFFAWTGPIGMLIALLALMFGALCYLIKKWFDNHDASNGRELKKIDLGLKK